MNPTSQEIHSVNQSVSWSCQGKQTLKKEKKQKKWQQTYKNNNVIVMTLENNTFKTQRKNAIHTCIVEQNFAEHLWLLP